MHIPLQCFPALCCRFCVINIMVVVSAYSNKIYPNVYNNFVKNIKMISCIGALLQIQIRFDDNLSKFAMMAESSFIFIF